MEWSDLADVASIASPHSTSSWTGRPYNQPPGKRTPSCVTRLPEDHLIESEVRARCPLFRMSMFTAAMLFSTTCARVQADDDRSTLECGLVYIKPSMPSLYPNSFNIEQPFLLYYYPSTPIPLLFRSSPASSALTIPPPNHVRPRLPNIYRVFAA